MLYELIFNNAYMVPVDVSQQSMLPDIFIFHQKDIS